MGKNPIGFRQHTGDDDDQGDPEEDGSKILPARDDDFATLELFRQKFLPGTSFKDSNEYLTTEEIFREMNSHTGGVNFNIKFLYKWLQENGYRYDTLDSMKAVWLLRSETEF